MVAAVPPRGPHPAREGRFFPDLDQEHLYLFIRCTPSCRANAILCLIDQIERFLIADLHSLRRHVEEAYREVQLAWEVIEG